MEGARVKDETIIRKIIKWSDYLNIEPPRVEIFDYGLLKDGTYIKGRYKNKVIQIYKKDREVVKHEFLHYLHDLLDCQCEDSVRKKVAMSWKNIKRWKELK